ncbi:MAG: FAD-binding protein [Deltaproteobacteria bacterium]|nr:MAG: FAD-binding protein [Deltaproteobacteria bacterium]
MSIKLFLYPLILFSLSLKASDLRIAIVGAGPSGLMAAHTLKKLGYKNITIFEKEDQVGGKVHSFTYNNNAYEMGAVLLGDNYTSVINLAGELDVPLSPFPTGLNFIGVRGEVTNFIDDLLHKHGLMKLFGAILHYKVLTHKYGSIHTDLALAHPDLFENFTTFARINHIEPLIDLFKPFVTGSGYGYPEEVPALYVMKLISWPLIKSLFASYIKLGDKILYFKEGYQKLFIKMAQNLNVNLNSKVTNIERIPGNDGTTTIYLTAGGVTQIFDKVIISTIPKTALNFIDASEEEEELFNKIKTYRYITTTLQVNDLGNKSLFFKNNFNRSAFGEVLILLNLNPTANLFVSYQFDSLDPIPSIEERGGSVAEILYQKEWDYFPHFTKIDLEDKPYRQLNKLQGKLGTYYVGGTLNFETVNDVLSHAKKLIMEKFSK